MMLTEMLEKTKFVIKEVSKILPSTFPHHISDSILSGLQKEKFYNDKVHKLYLDDSDSI